MPSDSHQDQWSSQWHQWHSSNPMMCTRPMPIKSYLGPCGTCHSLRVKESSCTPHLHDWHANVQARMLTPMCPCSCPCPCPSSLHQVSWCLTAMCALQQKNNNAYNADTTSDAIQASTWWAELFLVHMLANQLFCQLGSHLMQYFLNRGEPSLCLNKLNKSTSTLRTQQTTTPILDNVMCRMRLSKP